MLSRPDPLAPGDVIGVFLPSSPAREPFRDRGLVALRAMGFRPREVRDPISGSDFLSRSPKQTLEEMQEFFADSEVKALWAGRGGYGSNYLLPLLERLQIKAPKIVVASSDVSYLLWYLLDRREMVVFYGPMAYGGLAAGDYDRDQVVAALTANREPPAYAGEVLCQGRARGLVTGGCLSNFTSLLGTRHLPDVKGKVLLLEDVNERPFRLDRMLWQCEQAGIFRRVRALLFGEFPNCFKDPGEKEVFYSRWRERLSLLRIPVLTELPFGHAAAAQVIPLGVRAEVDADSTPGRIRCEIGVKW